MLSNSSAPNLAKIAARFDSRRVQTETELCRKLARWTADKFDELKNCDPQLPENAFNRLADNWRPLFAIAEIAGGDWPQRTHAAFVALTSSADLDAQGVGTMLLSDICRHVRRRKARTNCRPASSPKGWPQLKDGRGRNGEGIANRFPQTNSPTNCAALVSRRVGFELATKRLAVICSTISKRRSRDICLIPPLQTATLQQC